MTGGLPKIAVLAVLIVLAVLAVLPVLQGIAKGAQGSAQVAFSLLEKVRSERATNQVNWIYI
jgi:hypothetical protein